MQKIFHYLENVNTKMVVIFIIGALVLSKILQYVFEDIIVNIFQTIYMFSPGFIQLLLYPISESLVKLQPTEHELSIFFAISSFEFLGFFLEALAIAAIFWLIFERINKNNRLAEMPESTPEKYSEIIIEIKKVSLLLFSVFIGSYIIRSIISESEFLLIGLLIILPIIFSIIYGLIAIKHKRYPALLVVFIFLSLSGVLMLS